MLLTVPSHWFLLNTDCIAAHSYFPLLQSSPYEKEIDFKAIRLAVVVRMMEARRACGVGDCALPVPPY